MRQRPLTGPVLLILIGLVFLAHNIRPDLIRLSTLAEYWPFLLIAAGVVGLIEALFHAGRGSVPAPRPFSGGLIFWIIVLCIFLAIAGGNRAIPFSRFDIDNGGTSLFGTDYDYEVNAAAPAKNVNRIVLDHVGGNLSLKGVDSGEVKVTGRQSVRAFNRSAADREEAGNGIHLERTGDDLVLRTGERRGPRFARVSADLEIEVPRNMGVESRGRSGDLAIAGISGGVDLSSGRGDVRINHIGQDVRIDSWRSGDIHAADVKGGVELEGRGSDIQLESVAGPVNIKGEFSGELDFRRLAKPLEFTSSRTKFHVEAVPGEVTMNLGELKLSNVSGPVRFQSGTRDIAAADVTGLLDLKLDRGDIQFDATSTPLPRMDLHTRNGDITLRLPGNAGFELDGSTSRGIIESAFGSLRIDSSGHSAGIQGGNGPGAQITVATERGNISIQKKN